MTVYRSYRTWRTAWAGRLTPYEIRRHCFPTRRRGADPDQVRAFHERIADELTELHRELTMVSTENERLKQALRDWQSRTARQP